MGLESIILSDTMGIFRKLHEKKKGIGMAAALAASVTGGDVAQAKDYQQAVKMTPEIQQQMDYQKVPEFLAETMFKRIPNAKNIIRAVNLDRTGANNISYMMDPTDNTYDYEMGVTNNLPQLGMEEIQKPEYWVLLKLASMDKDQSDYWYWNGGSTYSRIFGNLSDKIKDEGVKHMGTALQNNMWGNSMLTKNKAKHEREREEHLLKALYIGATGSDNGVEPILNGQYQQLPEARELVREWEEKHNYSPFEKYEDNALLAYMVNTIRDSKISDPYLTSISIKLLNDFYTEENQKRKKMLNIISNNFRNSKRIPDFFLEKENQYLTYFDIFK